MFTARPFFERLKRASGFGAELDLAERGVGGAALSDRPLDAIYLIGSVAWCQERLAKRSSLRAAMPG